MALQHLRSSTANKRPVPGNMSEGQLAINTASGSPGLFFRDSNSNLVKVGPVHVGTTAPNASPASGGTAGNSVGEQWLDTSGTNPVLKVWDGSAWISQSGEFVNASGDVMTGALGIIAGTAGSPGLYFSGDTNTGVYSPGADQVAISTNGTGRLFVDASGNVGILDSSPQRDAGTTSLSIGDGSKASSVDFYGTVNNYTIYNGGSGQLAVYDLTNATERITLTPTGRLGLGSSSPTNYGAGINTLTINGSAGGVADFYYNGTRQGWIGTMGSNQVVIDTAGAAIPLTLKTNNNTALTIDTSQRVGIGTTSADERLHVVGNIKGVDGSGQGVQIINTTTPYIQALGTSTINDLQIKAKTVQFETGTTYSTSQRVQIDSSGRLLVGTSSGGGVAKLQVQGSTLFNDAFLDLCYNGSGSIAADTNLGVLRFTDQASSANIFAQIACATDAAAGSGDYPGRLVFSTTADGASSPTERMRIASDGAIYFQTTATPSTSSYGTVISSGNVLLHSRNTTSAVAQFYGSSGENRLLGNGSIQNTLNSYGAISDAKLKENIEAAGSQWDDLKALEVVNFNFIGSDQRQIGLVAQQVELISPGLVEDVPDDEAGTTTTKGVKYSVLYMKAVKALQEAMERIEALEARIAAAGI
jgi:hypothetical protein